MQTNIQAEIVWRLNTATGHLHAVGILVEAGRPCEEVIHQLRAVKAALRVAENRLLACQIQQSEEIMKNGSEEARTTELARLHRLYSLFVHPIDYESEANG